MHTPDYPMPTAKRRQTCTHPGTISATQTCNTATHGPWTRHMTANQTQRSSQQSYTFTNLFKQGRGEFYWKVRENK